MKTYSIVGMNFRKSEDFVKNLQAGTSAVLVREPTNKFDPNAVMVWIDGVHVGYVPKAQNKALAAFIDQTGAVWVPDAQTVPSDALEAIKAGEFSELPPLGDSRRLAADQQIVSPPHPAQKAIPAKFVRSPNSHYPMVEV